MIDGFELSDHARFQMQDQILEVDGYEWLSTQRLIPNKLLRSFLIGELNESNRA